MRQFLLSFITESNSYVGALNIFIIIFIMYSIINKNKKNYKLIAITSIVMFLVLVSMIKGVMINSKTVELIFITNDILAMFLISFTLNSKDDFKPIYKIILKIVNYSIIFVVIMGCIDYISGSKFQIWLQNHYFINGEYFQTDISRNMIGLYRYYSLFGHPLRLSGMILITYSLNLVYDKYIEKLNNINFISVISLIGIALTNSKSGIVCIIALIVLQNIKYDRKIIIRFIFLAIIIIIFVNTDFFNNVILQRFLSTDLTTGRAKGISYIVNGYIQLPSWIGQGYKYSYQLKDYAGLLIESFEYPPIMFSYDYGVIATSFIYIVILFYPLYKIIRAKKVFILGCFLIVFLQYNTHAAITVNEDAMGQLMFFTYIMLNTVSFVKTDEENIIDTI